MDNHDTNRFDFLRIVAALLVLYSHCYPLFEMGLSDPLATTPFISFGALGVWVFFVISGYLVTDSLQRTESLMFFFVKRVLRIYPALAASCLFSVLIIGPLFTPFSFSEYIFHPQTNVYWLNVTGFDIQYNLPLVFAENPKKHTVNGSLWTIPYELTCYVALALILGYSRTRRFLSVFLVLALFCLNYFRLQSNPTSPFETFIGFDHYHISLGAFFFTGALFSVFRDSLKPSWILIAIQIGLWVVVPEIGKGVLFHTIIATVVLYLGNSAHFLPTVSPRVGDLSYGTYLYAFPIQQSLVALGIRDFGFSTFVILSVFLTLLFALGSWHFIEKPLLNLKRRVPISGTGTSVSV